MARWPLWCLGLLWLAGCHSVPHADLVHHSRRQDFAPPHLFDSCPGVANAIQKGRPIPISLDTVLRLAQDQNGQVRLARMKLDDAQTDQEWAEKHWLPDLSVSKGVFRRVEAERRVWQQRGELSKVISENLLDASKTYIDLLAARSGVAISNETEGRLRDLLEQTTKMAAIDPGLQVEVSRIETELMAQNVLTVKLREASKSAAAKVAYLLGLDPCCEFIVTEKQLVPIKIMEAKEPVHLLVEQALTRGPGVRELEGLLQTLETARDANYGLSLWMPNIEVTRIEGATGAGPNQQFDRANRFDPGVRVKWSLMEFGISKLKRRQADSTIQQVQLTYHDLRSKLTLGVQEARDAIHSGNEQVHLAGKHIRSAEESYKLSDMRLKQNIKGRSSSEVLLALRSLGGARLEFLQAVRDFDKAQLRLFVLVGATEVQGQQLP